MLRGGRCPRPAASLLPAWPSVLRAVSRWRWIWRRWIRRPWRLRRRGLRRWWIRRWWIRRRLRWWGPLVEKPAPRRARRVGLILAITSGAVQALSHHPGLVNLPFAAAVAIKFPQISQQLANARVARSNRRL